VRRGRGWTLALALALTIVGVGSGARGSAQRVAPTYRLEVIGCELPGLASALSLEMGEALTPEGARTVRVECAGPTTHVVAEDALLAIRIERQLESEAVEPHLRERVVALVVTQLVDSLDRIEGGPPSIDAEVEDTMDETAQSPPPVASADPAPPESETPPVDSRTRSSIELSVGGGLRVHPIDATTAIGSVAIDVRYEWLVVGIEGGGAEVANRLAATQLGLLLGSVGVVPLRLSNGMLDAGLGAFAEGGAAWGRTVSGLAGYQGDELTALVLGAFVRGWMSLALAPRVSLRACVDVGWDYGLRVVFFDAPIASIDSLFVAVRLGASFWP